jgi:hypothetical protein
LILIIVLLLVFGGGGYYGYAHSLHVGNVPLRQRSTRGILMLLDRLHKRLIGLVFAGALTFSAAAAEVVVWFAPPRRVP